MRPELLLTTSRDEIVSVMRDEDVATSPDMQSEMFDVVALVIGQRAGWRRATPAVSQSRLTAVLG